MKRMLAFLPILLVLAMLPATSSSLLRGGGSVHRQLDPPYEDHRNWYTVTSQKSGNLGAIPGHDETPDRYTMTVWPEAEWVLIKSNQYFSGGKFEVNMTSAAVMPGVITALYLASGDGRTGDAAPGDQDELDFEFKGLTPQKIQTNVFLNGQESIIMVDTPFDSSQGMHTYGLEWNNTMAVFTIDGQSVRDTPLWRPLKPMKLHMSVWTTTGGWPGLIKWGGDTNWQRRNWQAITATFDILSMPN